MSLSRHEQVWLMRLLFERYSLIIGQFKWLCHSYLKKEWGWHDSCLTLQNSKHRKDNLFKNERKALKELQSNTSFVIFPAKRCRSTVILNLQRYLEKWMDHINTGPYLLYKKDPTTKIKVMALKQRHWKTAITDSKLYYYRSATRETTVYTLFISNNCASFHMWWKKSLVKNQEVSKYYKLAPNYVL